LILLQDSVVKTDGNSSADFLAGFGATQVVPGPDSGWLSSSVARVAIFYRAFC